MLGLVSMTNSYKKKGLDRYGEGNLLGIGLRLIMCYIRVGRYMKEKNHHLVFKAFADPSRLRILQILTQGERCVCDIMAVLKMGQSKVSRHLAYLRRAGLVLARREGLWIHYSLSKPVNKLQERLLDCVGDCLNDTPVFRRDRDLLKKIISKKAAKEKRRCH
jgi:ArsR family transcriptional regulator